VFGWLDTEFVQPMMLFGLLIGLIGMLGWNYSIKVLDPLVFSTVQLVSPALTGIIAYAIGLEGIN
jgi:drug/metabolite transporter (DMT)-like permease